MTEFLLPDDGQFYSSGRGASSITRGPDGALWFTEVFARKIGRITTAGMIGEYFLENSASSPQKIVAGPDGALWFTEFLNQNGRIGRITIDGTISEYELSPCQGTCGRYPNGITAGPDGALWFTDLGDDRIHSITIAGTVTDYGLVAVGNEGYAPGSNNNWPRRSALVYGQWRHRCARSNYDEWRDDSLSITPLLASYLQWLQQS
jgi:virginiamycin B lyase